MTINIENENELLTYLRDQGHLLSGEMGRVEILRGGVSNRTVLLERSNGESWVLKQALSKLRVKEDWFSEPHRIQLEARGMQWLAKLSPPGSIPRLVFLDESRNILAMEAVPQPHYNYKALLLNGQIQMEYFRQFGALLGTIHSQAGIFRKDIAETFADRSFFETLRMEPYYEFTATKIPSAKAFLEALCRQCRSHCYTIVHGDYSPKNILIHRDKLVLLDHEVIHFGDGTFDIGFALCHLLSKANHLRKGRRLMIEGALLFCRAYLEVNPHWNPEREQRAVDHTLACLLARVHGRSPHDYFSSESQQVQTQITSQLIGQRPADLKSLILTFEQKLNHD